VKGEEGAEREGEKGSAPKGDVGEGERKRWRAAWA
jgi:hypothetical protein